MKKVDLNVDIGEGFPNDEALLEFATSANVCCGEHAGSWELTQETIELCRGKGIRIGAHPGYPDRANMGREPIRTIEQAQVLSASVDMQMQRFRTYYKPAYLKPHGAWYNFLINSHTEDIADVRERTVTVAIVASTATRSQGLTPLMILPGEYSRYWDAFDERLIISEGFADRAYTEQGTLKPRTEPGAVLHDPEQIKAQVLRLAPEVDSICIHGDTPNCLEFAEMVSKTLVDHGYEVGY